MRKKIHDLAMIEPDTIEILDAIPLLFIRRSGNYSTSSEKFWNAMIVFVEANHLNKTKTRYFSISHDNPDITDEDNLRFDACIEELPGIQVQGEIGRQTLKGGKFIVFTHNGPYHTLEETFDRIFLKWFPNTQEDFDEERLIFCEHFHIEHVGKDESKLVTKIYLPII